MLNPPNLPLLSDLSATMYECTGDDVTVRVNLPSIPINTAEFDMFSAQLQAFVARLDSEDWSGAPHPLVKGCTLDEGEAGPGRWAALNAVPF